MECDTLSENLTQARMTATKAISEKDKAMQTVDRLTDQITELRSRPIEVAVAEPSKDVRQLEETIKNLELSTERQMAQMEDEHLRDVQTLHKKADAEKEEALRKLTEEYEEKLAAAGKDAAQSDDKQVFKAYYSAAYDTFNRMLDFARRSADKEFFRDKIDKLLTTFATGMNTM
jgi:chromosome segregation ATPase